MLKRLALVIFPVFPVVFPFPYFPRLLQRGRRFSGFPGFSLFWLKEAGPTEPGSGGSESDAMMEASPQYLLFSCLLICCITTEVSAVHLTVSPSRSQFFEFESVTLICEDENRSDGWTVRSNTSRGVGKRCGDEWGEAAGSTCNITLFTFDTGLYWCESGSSNSSSSSSCSSSSCSIQLSVSGSVILQSPVLPVMEGDDVTLSCRARNPTHNLPAAFYKDGSFIGDGSAGSMTLLHVSSSDEGLYKCSISGSGESPSSRVSVKASNSTVSD